MTSLPQAGIANSGLALGGLGTGGVELWPDGRFYFWNIVNSRPWAKAFKEHRGDARKGDHSIDPIVPKDGDTDFFIRIERPGRRPVYRWLFTGHGLLCTTASHFYRHHRFFFIKSCKEIVYRAEYPFIYLTYVDDELPVKLELRAWTPFIPRDVKNSSLPGFYLDFSVRNKTAKPLDVSLVWQMQNLAGYAAGHVIQHHEKVRRAGAHMVRMQGSTADMQHDSSGDMAMWVAPRTGQNVTSIAANPYMQNLMWSIHCTGGLKGPLMPEWLTREELNETPREQAPNKGWLCVQERIPARKATTIAMGLAWFFPNHRSVRGTRVGHVYENWFSGATDVAAYLVRNHDALCAKSRELPELILASTMPGKVKVSLLDQLSTLVKNSHFVQNGRFGIQEGHGCCAFNTVDVDHYSSYALSFLFPQLRKKVLEMQTELAHPVTGKIHHGLPGTVEEVEVTPATTDGYTRWDCCCQYTLQLYRDTRWAGDRRTMAECFPTAHQAMKLVADLDFYGVALPFIHGGITYDHWNMQGVVGYMAGVYLAAMRALEDMAALLGEDETRAWARERFERGRASFEQLLWNGDQYLLFYGRRPKGWKAGDDGIGEHKIVEAVRPPDVCCDSGCGCERPRAYIELQDTGVMTDLLNGNATAEVMGLGAFLQPSRVRKQLRLIMQRNCQEENQCVINGSYPDAHFLDEFPFAQWQTPWTGTEYFLAAQLYCAGMLKEGDRVIEMVFDRHTREGMRWDQTECNNHYSRPLSIWAAYAARLGLDMDMWRGRLALCPPGQDGYTGLLLTAVATCAAKLKAGKARTTLDLEVRSGGLKLKTLLLPAPGRKARARIEVNAEAAECQVRVAGGKAEIVLARQVALKAGDTMHAVVRA